MRHRKAGVKLNKTSSHRLAMFRNMVTSLFKFDRIRTTDAKAKELRRWADHLITLAKRGDLHARRQALAIIREKDVVHKLFEEASGRYGAISGGYTRLVKLGIRPGDAARVTLVELAATTTAKKTAPKTKPELKPKPVVTSPGEAIGDDTSIPAAAGEAKAPETEPIDTVIEAGQTEEVTSESVEPPPTTDSKEQG